MALTKRARRRLTMLVIGLFLVAGAGVGLWFLQQSLKDARAAQAKIDGLAAAARGEWEIALPDLSLAVARDPTDVATLLMLAEARSRVAEENRRHITTAMTYFTRASELADVSGESEELRQRALQGRARMELALAEIARLERTALEMLGLDDPDADVSAMVFDEDDRDALAYLLEIRRRRGDYLPDDVQLIVRGDRSDADWLQALRLAPADDRMSALRWALERLLVEPGSLDRRRAVLDILRQGGSVDAQRIAGVDEVERPVGIAARWTEEAGPDVAAAELVLASEHLRSGTPDRIDRAREALRRAEAAGLDRPSDLLDTITLYEVLATSEDRGRAATLLSEAESRASTDSVAANGMAQMHWNAGRSAVAMRLLDDALAGTSSVDDQIDSSSTAVLLAALDGRDDVAERVADLESRVEASSLDFARRDRVQRIVEIATIVDADVIDSDALETVETVGTLLPGNFLVQALVGDVRERAGLQAAANEAWTRAGRIMGHRSVPIGRRVLPGLRQAGDVEEAFRQARMYAAGTQSVLSAIALAEAWLALDETGVDPTEVVPGFELGEDPLEFIQQLEADVESIGLDPGIVAPTLIEAATRRGRPELAGESIDRALANSPSATMLFRLAAQDRIHDLGRMPALLARLREVSESEQDLDRLAILEAEVLRDAGDADAALRMIETRFADRTDESARLALASERLALAEARDAPMEDELRAMLALATNPRIFRRIHRLAIDRDLEEISREVVDRASGNAETGVEALFGTQSPVAMLTELEHVLAFELENPASIRNAVARADDLVASGQAPSDLEIAFARVCQAADPPLVDLAIDTLTRCVQTSPGRFDAAVMLIDLLQNKGRYERAEELMSQLYRRRDAAPPAIQRMIPTLLAGQGDPDMVAVSACELAERTGDPLDRLECARARSRAGDIEAADALLDELLAEPDRPFAVDIEGAARLVRRGDPSAAVALLRASTSFPNELRRELAIAGLLLQQRDWPGLAEVLDGIGDAGRESAEVSLIRALLLLGREDRDPSSARLALDRAAELAPDDAGVLRRNVTIRLSDEDLRATAEPAIDLLADLRPEEANLMRLAFDASPDGQTYRPTPGHLDRAEAIVELQPTSRPGWTLALDLFGAASDQALSNGDLMAADRYSDKLVELAERAVTRFPGDQAFPAQLSRIHLVLGNFDDAAAAANESIRRAGDSPVLGSVVPLATVQGRLRRWDDVIQTLAPFRREIEEGADARPRAWRLLLDALVRSGRIDEAWTVFQARTASRRPQGLLDWLLAVEGASPEAAIAGVDRAIESLPPGGSPLPAIGALAAVHRTTSDPRVRARAEALLDGLATGNANPALAMQLAITRLGLDEKLDPAGTLDKYLALVDGLPPGTIDRLRNFRSLGAEERRAVAPIANAALMAMNNFAAVAATLVLDGELPPDRIPAVLNRAQALATALGEIDDENAELLDTRALVALAMEDGETAAALEIRALRVNPRRATFRFNLARALEMSGDVEGAMLQAREALRQCRRETEPDRARINRIEGFIDRLQG